MSGNPGQAGLQWTLGSRPPKVTEGLGQSSLCGVVGGPAALDGSWTEDAEGASG